MTTRMGRNPRVLAALCVALLMVGLCVTGAPARTRHRRRKPAPTLTPTATPTVALHPVVLITANSHEFLPKRIVMVCAAKPPEAPDGGLSPTHPPWQRA